MITFYILCVLICITHLVWTYTLRSTFLEVYKSQLFKYRNLLFDLADKGALSFDDEVYTAMEERISRMIYSAGELSFSRFLITLFFAPPVTDSKPVHELYHNRLGQFNQETKERLTIIESDVYAFALIYLIKQNFVTLIFMEFIRLLRKATRTIKDLSSLKNQFQPTVIAMSYQAK